MRLLELSPQLVHSNKATHFRDKNLRSESKNLHATSRDDRRSPKSRNINHEKHLRERPSPLIPCRRRTDALCGLPDKSEARRKGHKEVSSLIAVQQSRRKDIPVHAKKGSTQTGEEPNYRRGSRDEKRKRRV